MVLGVELSGPILSAWCRTLAKSVSKSMISETPTVDKKCLFGAVLKKCKATHSFQLTKIYPKFTYYVWWASKENFNHQCFNHDKRHSHLAGGKNHAIKSNTKFSTICFTLFEHTIPLYHHQILLTTVILLYFACTFFININKKNYIFKQENLIFREEWYVNLKFD